MVAGQGELSLLTVSSATLLQGGFRVSRGGSPVLVTAPSLVFRDASRIVRIGSPVPMEENGSRGGLQETWCVRKSLRANERTTHRVGLQPSRQERRTVNADVAGSRPARPASYQASRLKQQIQASRERLGAIGLRNDLKHRSHDVEDFRKGLLAKCSISTEVSGGDKVGAA